MQIPPFHEFGRLGPYLVYHILNTNKIVILHNREVKKAHRFIIFCGLLDCTSPAILKAHSPKQTIRKEEQQWDTLWPTREAPISGGTGKRVKPKVVKVYTRECTDKLEARRVAKAAPAEAALRRQEWQREGFFPNGDGFLCTGETCAVRAKIKASGGRWQPIFDGWTISPHSPVPWNAVKQRTSSR